MKYFIPLVLAVTAWTTSPLSAATPGGESELAARLQQLEAETQALRAELQQMREEPVALPQVSATPVSYAPGAKNNGDVDYYTFSELSGMMQSTAKKYAWTKGDFTIVPYGFLWGNMVYESGRTYSPGRSYVLWVMPGNQQGDDKVFLADGKNTRFGIDVGGPRLPLFCCAKTGGKIEFDFQGDFANTENKGGVLLRHAYVEAKNSDYRLLIGQTWDIISPLYPTTCLYSVYWDLGNIGYRRPQLRYERYLAFSNTTLLTLQGSLNANILSDFNGHADIIREPGGWPTIEGRAALTLGHRGKGCKPTVVGVSAHIGEVGFDYFNGGALVDDDVRRRTWSFNTDLDMPITSRFGVRGELFCGEALGTYLGGIGQSINPNTLEPIRSQGGWVELYYYWTYRLHSHFAYGVDDPFDQDIPANGRLYNQFYYANIMFDATKQFQLGFEVGQLKTLYNGLDEGNSTRLEFMARYAF
ncbi:MAG: bZIP transcription factor [Pirellulales bacterium]|nr:bZIP transcription factor [Pirellulales bacterium]